MERQFNRDEFLDMVTDEIAEVARVVSIYGEAETFGCKHSGTRIDDAMEQAVRKIMAGVDGLAGESFRAGGSAIAQAAVQAIAREAGGPVYDAEAAPLPMLREAQEQTKQEGK